MSGSNSSQGVYAPLPQTFSDTDSEEELNITSGVDSTKASTQPRHNANVANGGETMRNYHPLDEADEPNNVSNGFIGVTFQDREPIIKDGKNVDEKMSLVRKIGFVASIAACFLMIIILLWVLPCEENLTCPANMGESIHTTNWEKIYYGIELKNSISVVSGVRGHSRNIVFLFRGDTMNKNLEHHDYPMIPTNGGGLISIVGNSGKVAWFIPQQRVPTDIDCGILDVDGDGNFDCIVVMENGSIEAIQSVSGAAIWKLYSNIPNFICTEVDFPLVLSDLDKDGVDDLLTSCSTNNSNLHNTIILISGKTGGIIGNPYIVSECITIHKISIDKNQLVSYICQNVTFKESYIGLSDLYRKITKNNSEIYNNYEMIKQHLTFGQKQNGEQQMERQRHIYTVHNRKLIVENEGNCPDSCNVTVQLIDQQTGKENLTWSHTGTRMYGMVPAILIFNDTKENREALKGHISGFILKFWQWNEHDKYRNEKLSLHNHSRKMYWSIFDGVTKRQTTWSSPNVRLRRSIPNAEETNKISPNISIQLLTERVVLITFNATDIHIVNASQNEITQLCTVVNGKTICQPDLNYQENSVFIADLDKDGSQELISYLSTYVNVDEYHDRVNEEAWQLQSIVKVVRLEAELPKLYEAVSKY